MTYLVTEDEFKSALVNEDGDLTFTRDNGEVVNAGSVTGDSIPELLTARDQAVGAKEDAEASKGAAADSATSAASARDGAEAARNDAATSATAASTARTGAESARDDAQTARTGAEGAASDASGSASAASGSADAAAASAGEAQAERTGAETARAGAEDARDETIVDVTDLGDVAGAVALSQAQSRSSFIRARLTGNVTVTPAAGLPGVAYSCTLRLAQDATGGRTLTLANVATAYGVAIALSPGANQVDLLHLMWNGSSWSAFLGAAQLSIPAGWIV